MYTFQLEKDIRMLVSPLGVARKIDCGHYSIYLASGFICDLFTKSRDQLSSATTEHKCNLGTITTEFVLPGVYIRENGAMGRGLNRANQPSQKYTV